MIMAIVPTTGHSWLFSPPLDLPLRLRAENGRFDSLRPRPLRRVPDCATANVMPADDPRNPTGRDVHFGNGIHQACDLASTAGSCVYSAYSGRVVEVNTGAGGEKGNVRIDHHPQGLGFLTQYMHISDIQVERGDFVHEGEPIAQVSSVPEEPTLHFELWAVVDRTEIVPGDSGMVPLDPTRALYAWETRLTPDEPLPGTPVPTAVGVTRVHTLPFFYARFADVGPLHVPLYEPVSEEETLLVRILQEAHRTGAGVALSFRRSAFWGLDVVTQAEIG
jgi:murein DD-endopeptidase MepM/ murein hydrolase activator NlpD